MKKTYQYFAQLVQQRPGSMKTVYFIAKSEEIKKWGGIPSKSANYMRGFQRALIKEHKTEITTFFETDEKNISPTCIVAAFKPSTIVIKEIPDLKKNLPKDYLGEPVLISFEVDDEKDTSIDDLAKKVAGNLRSTFKDIASEASEGEENEESASTNDTEEDSEDEVSLSIGNSHLKSFIENLEKPEWIAKSKTEDSDGVLRTLLQDFLKPATIVDGQHRTEGAAYLEQGIPFPVVGLIDADWREEVFQFVVINQRAKPIKSEFLSAIIASSLSKKDIEELNTRLEQAGVDLLNTNIMQLVHTSPKSPFVGMIDYKIKGAKGQLKYSGMLSLAKRFRKLTTSDPEIRFKDFFKQVFLKSTTGVRYTDKRSHWMEGEWFNSFCIFWSTVKDHFDKRSYGRLWEYNTNFMKIVALQELQGLFLFWLNQQREELNESGDLKIKVERFIKNLNGPFYSDTWKKTSLQSDTGRKILRRALHNALMQVDYKNNDDLFKD
jgi:hypothetical protein